MCISHYKLYSSFLTIRKEKRRIASEKIRTHTEDSSAVPNPWNAELTPICHMLALVGAHHIFHVSSIRVNLRKFWRCFSLQPNVLRRRGQDVRAGTAPAEGGQNAFYMPSHVPGRRRWPGGSCPGTGYVYLGHNCVYLPCSFYSLTSPHSWQVLRDSHRSIYFHRNKTVGMLSWPLSLSYW
jgi:hypothetical protein